MAVILRAGSLALGVSLLVGGGLAPAVAGEKRAAEKGAAEKGAPEKGAPEKGAAAPAKIGPWPDDAEVQRARDAYNNKAYAEAVRSFVGIAQRHPRNAMVYLGLARSSAMAGEAVLAVVAYRFYLELSVDPTLKEKAKAELDNQLKKVRLAPAAGPPAAAAQLMSRAFEAADSQQFLGEAGAFKRFEQALAAGYISPKLIELESRLDDAVSGATEKAIADWWAVERQLSPRRLSDLRDTWRIWLARGGVQTARTVAFQNAIEGLIQLYDREYSAAVDTLGLAAAGDPRLRFAQSIALFRADRLGEVETLLEDLSAREEDPRFGILLGWVQSARHPKRAGVTLKGALLD